MTVQRTYYCNLCNASGVPLRGVYWQQQGMGEHAVERPPREVEHHICERCLADLQKFQPQVGEKP